MYVNSCIPTIRHWAYGWGSEENVFYGQNTVGILLQYFVNPQEGAMGHSFVNHPTSKIFLTACTNAVFWTSVDPPFILFVLI